MGQGFELPHRPPPLAAARDSSVPLGTKPALIKENDPHYHHRLEVEFLLDLLVGGNISKHVCPNSTVRMICLLVFSENLVVLRLLKTG